MQGEGRTMGEKERYLEEITGGRTVRIGTMPSTKESVTLNKKINSGARPCEKRGGEKNPFKTWDIGPSMG